MSLRGTAFLALWNDINPMRDAEYNLWHTREHVPERLTVPGILAAHRYVARSGPHSYFTLYDLETNKVLESAAYKNLVDNPTSWSRSMRPDFRNFLRYPCQKLVSLGRGTGCAVTTMRFVMGEPIGSQDIEATGLLCRELLTEFHDLTNIHMGHADLSTPFPLQAAAPEPNIDGVPYVLLIEGSDFGVLLAAMERLKDIPLRLRSQGALEINTYRLAYSIAREDLGGIPAPFTPPGR
jgi:hypothetical protein